ncbi:hypothetical protein KW115_17530 [Methylococcus sp. Mc7]|nr:hypothetical protein KW115_17530 [Methylococcus sp. Mc7]
MRGFHFSPSKLWLPLVLVLAAGAAAADEADRRRVLKLTEGQRAHVLGEMRALLSGTQAILSSLSRDDMAAAAQQARSLGTSMGHKAENTLHGVLPKEFMQLGMSVHRDFDRIAADAETLKDPKHTLRQLSESMTRCTACHDTYRLQAARPKRKP